MYKLKLYNDFYEQQYKEITDKHIFKSEKQAIWWLYNQAWQFGIDTIQNYNIVRV